MPIRRRYSPPFQTAAPQLGADDMGRTVKGLVSVELARSSEISFAVESFGCDGKPVLSLMHDLPCEADGKLVMAGTKNGMPFKLNADLPRSIGSAIRGSGGAMRTVSAGGAFRTTEWVLYDNFGNAWTLDGGTATYRGETPLEANGDGTPAICTQAPRCRPYEKRWEYIELAGDPPANQVKYRFAGCGWIFDPDPSPVIAYPVAYPYALPSDYYRVEQWIPDETTPPAGGDKAGAWPTSLRHVEVEWYPGRTDLPFDWRADTTNSIDVIVAKYLDDDSGNWWSKVYMNRWHRPLLEHISVGGVAGEDIFLVCVEKDLIHYPFNSRIALRRGQSGALLGTIAGVTLPEAGRVFFTPDTAEGWFMQTGEVTGDTVTLRRLRSRAASTDPFGSALTELASVTVTLPADAAHAWETEPVFFRVGKITTLLGRTPYLIPRLPLWR